jgi:hypothetical protein
LGHNLKADFRLNSALWPYNREVCREWNKERKRSIHTLKLLAEEVEARAVGQYVVWAFRVL